MRKILLYIFLVCGACTQVLAQFSTTEPCPRNTVTTSPGAPGSANTWDWQGNPISVFEHIKATGANQVQNFSNPYHDFTNPNTLPLVATGPAPGFADLRDYKPEDGWELVMKQFTDPVVPTKGITHPMYILYNKYRSLLRVFIAISDKDEDYNGSFIRMSFVNTGGTTNPDKGSALMSYATPVTTALDKVKVNQDMRVFNQWVNVDDFWLYADFFVAYDPCTCNEISKLKFEVYLSETANIDLVTKGKNANNQTVNAVTNKTINTIAETYDYVMKFVGNVSDASTKKAKSTTDAITKAEEALGYLDKDITNNKSFKFPSWAKQIPKIGAVVGILEFMFTGTKKEQVVATGTSEQRTTGTITAQYLYKFTTIVNPGANKGLAPLEMIPEYNNVLGVFNLLETPKVEYVDYYPNIKYIRYVNSAGQEIDKNNPMIREYKLKEDLKYVVNPAAGLRIKSAECALVYEPPVSKTESQICYGTYQNYNITHLNKYNYGPVETGLIDPGSDFHNRLGEQGVFINYWPEHNGKSSINSTKYNTRYVDKECFSGARFKVWEHTPGSTQIWCKLVIVFESTDGSKKEVMSVLTFPVTVESSALNLPESGGYKYYFQNLTHHRERYFDWGCICWKDGDPENYHLMTGAFCIIRHPISSLDNSPFGPDLVGQTKDTVDLENISFTTNTTISAWKLIRIKSNVTMADGIQLKLASENVEINPDFIAKPGFEIVMARPDFCLQSDLQPVSQNGVYTFCNSTTYKDKLALSSLFDEMPPEEDTAKAPNAVAATFDFNVFPNPNDGVFRVSFDEQEHDVVLVVLNTQGQRVFESTYDKNQRLVDLELSHLAKGVYIVQLITPASIGAKKIIIQ